MEKKFFPAVFVLAFTVMAMGAKSCQPAFHDCGSVAGKILGVSFNGSCTSDKHIELKKGTTVQMKVDLDSDDSSKTLTANVHGIIAGVPVHFPLPNPNACKNCNITCPIEKGKQYVYSTDMFVSNAYPKLKLIVKWELYDDLKKDLVCMLVPAVITS